jgi:hypothetical protein
MKVKVKFKEIVHERLSAFVIDRKNRHLFTKVKTINGDVYLRKNRLSTVLHVDSWGKILKIVGENPNNNKIGESIYK